MPKILLGVSVLFIAAAAVFGFLSKAKITDLKGNIETLNSNLSSANSARSKAESDKKTAEDQLAVATTRADAATAETATARAEVTRVQGQVQELQGQIDPLKAEVTRLNGIIAQGTQPGVDGAVAPDAAQTAALQTQVTELTSKLKEAEQVNSTLVAQAKDAEEKARTLQQQEERRQGRLMAKGLEGQVIAVNQSWSFVVLGIGDRQGVVPNAEMIVVRGGQAIGKVRVSSVEPSTAIADVVPGTLRGGVRIQPGDRVIYQGT